MRDGLRWAVVAIGTLHGLLHLLGAAKGLGLAEVEGLSEPIGARTGWAWALATLFLLVTVVLVALDQPQWGAALIVAAVASQLLIVTSWADAKAGTIANVLLAAAGVWELITE